jgi:hypothetical protein
MGSSRTAITSSRFVLRLPEARWRLPGPQSRLPGMHSRLPVMSSRRSAPWIAGSAQYQKHPESLRDTREGLARVRTPIATAHDSNSVFSDFFAPPCDRFATSAAEPRRPTFCSSQLRERRTRAMARATRLRSQQQRPLNICGAYADEWNSFQLRAPAFLSSGSAPRSVATEFRAAATAGTPDASSK